jgi:hypothetical protein
VLERDGRIILPDGDTESNSKQWGVKYDELASRSPESRLLTNKTQFCNYLRETYLFTTNPNRPTTCVYSKWFEVKKNSFRTQLLAEKRKARANVWTKPSKLFRDQFPAGYPKEWVNGVIHECFSEGEAQIRVNDAWIACPKEDDLTREDGFGHQLIVATRRAQYKFLAYSISNEERVLERDGRIILPDGDTESNSKQWGVKYDDLASHSPDSRLLTNKSMFCTYLRETYLFTANTDKPTTCVYTKWFEVKKRSFRSQLLAEKRKARANVRTKPSASSASFGSAAPGKPVPNYQTSVRCLLTLWRFDRMQII